MTADTNQYQRLKESWPELWEQHFGEQGLMTVNARACRVAFDQLAKVVKLAAHHSRQYDKYLLATAIHTHIAAESVNNFLGKLYESNYRGSNKRDNPS